MVIPQRWHQSERHSILGEKMKIYPQVLTFFIKPKTWLLHGLLHVVVLLTTATKWTKVKNARAGRAKLLFLPTKNANSWRSRCRRRCRCLSSLLSSGVPQGSILGPLLFSIYVNDLPAVPQKCISHSYVDDTKLQVSFKLQNKEIAVAEMNEDLFKVCNWCFRNYLLLNPDKSKLMVFGTRKMLPKLQDITLSLLGKDLSPSETAKDLGVLLDPHLSYNNHIIKTVSPCMSSLGQINRVKHAFDRKTLLIVINALVFSKLFYCSNVWANCSKLNIDKLQSVQNFACRIVCGIRKYDHVTPELKRLKWLPVSSQLYYRNTILAFKCMNCRAPEYLSTIFTKRSDVNSYTTRSSQFLNIPLFKTASGQRTFYYRTVSIWNSLESNLKLCGKEIIFKKRLRNKLLRDFLGSDWYRDK